MDDVPTRDPAAAALLGVGCALPPTRVERSGAARFLSRVAAAHLPSPTRERTLSLIERVTEGSGVRARHTVIEDYGKSDADAFTFLPKNWALDPFPTTAARMALFEETSVPLAQRAAEEALADSGVSLESVTHLVVTTCTGFFAPGIDVALVDALGLSSDVKRTAIGFMGCYAGFNAMRSAAEIVGADPSACVLTVSVELCTLHLQRAPDPELVIANALFGDGAAAAVWGSHPSGGAPRLVATRTRIAPDSRDQMAWRIGDHGFEMTLSPRVPAVIEAVLPGWLDAWLATIGRRRADLTHFAVHPGGPRVLDATERGLRLSDEALDASREVFRTHGNMSSPTVLFILARELRRARHGLTLAIGFGPGLAIEAALIAAGPPDSDDPVSAPTS